jgi:hypothetical protein
VVQSGLYVTATGATSYTCVHALKLNQIYGYCYVCIHACATAKLESQRKTGSKTPGKGAAAAGRTKLLLYYCRIQETPGTPEDTRGNKEGHQRDWRAQRHHEDRRAQRGDRGRYQEDRREQRGDRSRLQGHRDPTQGAKSRFQAVITIILNRTAYLDSAVMITVCGMQRPWVVAKVSGFTFYIYSGC